jgi:response regulator RpfG family c-di-GMP phosphodiesterase
VRVLLVDDDAGLRALLRMTFDVFEIEVVEAGDAFEARAEIDRRPPDVVILDVLMPGMDGIEFCRELKSDRATRGIGVVLLSGSEGGSRVAADAAGAEAYVPKPFSPLELLAVVERLAGGLYGVPFRAAKRSSSEEEQLLLYARDLRHLLQIERAQRSLVQQAYRETVAALASALESKDTGTRAHSERVQRYAIELARCMDSELADDPSAEYGFLLHDVGKIGIPDRVLQKPGPLDKHERNLMQTHTIVGEQMLGGVALLQGTGVHVVRSHHERWDGDGYPDGLVRDEIPLGARIFAVADTLDAITSDRPYRSALPWSTAHEVIVDEAGRQFDPEVVDAFLACEPSLRSVRRDFQFAAA